MESKNHVLVVDDDRDIRVLLGDFLKLNGFRISLASNGRQMREVLAGDDTDLVVLDLMLPGEDGLRLCRDLRTRSDVPVLMLTARAEPIDRVLGLEMGADDYLAKPFEPRELLARIRNILRRVQSSGVMGLSVVSKEWRFSGWVLNRGTRELVSPLGVLVLLSGAEYRLLEVFLNHQSRA
ncbi:response regulator [Methylogaea oryzae]|uniref:response regulator n=1 Tax=Methylogaea oryzae TaxID=1295382 RepID=UPI0020D19EE3|nr:response regulator [Methylogaea oryzae]